MPYNNLEQVGAESIAPSIYGWKLDGAAVNTAVRVGDQDIDLELTRFFPCGIALGVTAAGREIGPDCTHDDGHGPQFRIYPAGMLTVDGKHAGAPGEAEINLIRQNALTEVGEVPDLFAPRLGETAPLAGDNACPDQDGQRGVYFYASELEPDPQGPTKMVITWYRMLPNGDCDAEPNTYQMVVSALPANGVEFTRPARIEYRFADCGWSVPNQAQLEDQPDFIDLNGIRSGLLFDSAAGIGGDLTRGFEVLGSRNENFPVSNGGLVNPARPAGASGDPTRHGDYCTESNQVGENTLGVFVFELDINGRPKQDNDLDGVHDDLDNCMFTANPYQEASDGDPFGDACDGDVDGDSTANDEDLCPFVPANLHFDLDGDMVGDLCDDDKDGDQHPNEQDNCPEIPNFDQADLDGDGVGMVCDGDDLSILFGWILEPIDFSKVPIVGFGLLDPEVVEALLDFPTSSETKNAKTFMEVVKIWATKRKVTTNKALEWLDAVGGWSLKGNSDAFKGLSMKSENDAELRMFHFLEDWAQSKMALHVFYRKHGRYYFGAQH